MTISVFKVGQGFIRAIVGDQGDRIATFLQDFPRCPRSLLLLLPCFVLCVLVMRAREAVFM